MKPGLPCLHVWIYSFPPLPTIAPLKALNWCDLSSTRQHVLTLSKIAINSDVIRSIKLREFITKIHPKRPDCHCPREQHWCMETKNNDLTDTYMQSYMHNVHIQLSKPYMETCRKSILRAARITFSPQTHQGLCYIYPWIMPGLSSSHNITTKQNQTILSAAYTYGIHLYSCIWWGPALWWEKSSAQRTPMTIRKGFEALPAEAIRGWIWTHCNSIATSVYWACTCTCIYMNLYQTYMYMYWNCPTGVTVSTRCM